MSSMGFQEASGGAPAPLVQEHEMDLEKLQASARKASTLLKAMSNEHRLLILCQLVGGEKSVGELVRLVGLSQSALSQHLARLRRDSLVRTRREAQTIHYSVASHEALALLQQLYELYCAAPAREAGRIEDHARPAASAAHS
jgi:DNA-binding transcriptional ArsR family regulator